MNITDRARAEAERQWPSYPAVGFSGAGDRQAAFIAGAEWAASLPPTDEEVLAALNAYTGEDDWDIEFWGGYADDMRAALTAAREAR